VFSDECRGSPPVPPPRYKKKQKLAPVTTVNQLSEITDKAAAKITPPKIRRHSTSFVDMAIITNDCYSKDDTSQDNNNGIVATDELTAKTVNDKAVNGTERSYSVWVTDQPNYHVTNGRRIGKVNNVCTRCEEYYQNDSGVYLPEAMLSQENENHGSLIQTENDFRSLCIQDTINSTSKHLISLDPVMSMLDNLHKVSNECEMTAGLLRDCTSFLSLTNKDPKHLLDEARTCTLCNTHVSKASTHIVGDSHILLENVKETSSNIVNRTCKCLNHEKSLKTLCTESSHLCMDSHLQFSICGSGGTGSVFRKREKDLCNEALSQNKSVFQLPLPKEPVPTDVALVSSISFPSNQCHFNHLNHATEENTYPRQSGLGLLSSNEKDSVSVIKYNTRNMQVKASSADISVVNDLTNAVNWNNYTAVGRRIPKKSSISEGDCCSYSALDNFEVITLNENRENQWVVSGSTEVVNKEHICYKNNNCMTIARREELHPKKLSKSLHIFLKNMLTDDEEYDLNYQSDNAQGSINFKCALNHTEVTNTTGKTNKRVVCLELQNGELTGLPHHFTVSPRCTVVESCVAGDGVHNASGYHSQHVCDSEDCCVMSATAPSSNKSSHSPLHAEHRMLITSDCSNNITKSEELTEELIVGNNITEDCFVTVNKSATLPSFGSTDTINRSYNYSHDQIAIRSNVQDTLKSRNKPQKRNEVIDDCLDGLRTGMEEDSG
jgi:hypothetical protein